MLRYRKNNSVLRILLLAAVVLATVFQTASALTLKIATISPDGTSWMKKMRAGATEIATRTDGRVKLKFYPGGVMGNDQSVLRKIRIGQLHGGALTDGGLRAAYVDTQIYGIPFTFRSLDEVTHVRATIDRVIMEGLEKNGFVTFGLAEGGFAYIMSNKPIQNADELKGQKMWTPDGDKLSRIMLETGGVSPIPLSLSDVMTGLQTGLLDTVVTSPIGAIALQWHTRVKYITDTPLAYFYAALAIDKKVFRKISGSDQAIMREVMGKIYADLDKQNRVDNTKARKALANQGIKFVAVSEDERRRWQQIAEQARKKWVAEGLYSPKLFDRVNKMLADYRDKSQTQ